MVKPRRISKHNRCQNGPSTQKFRNTNSEQLESVQNNADRHHAYCRQQFRQNIKSKIIQNIDRKQGILRKQRDANAQDFDVHKFVVPFDVLVVSISVSVVDIVSIKQIHGSHDGPDQQQKHSYPGDGSYRNTIPFMLISLFALSLPLSLQLILDCTCIHRRSVAFRAF